MSPALLDVLLVEPYFGGSHRAWAEGYAHHSRHRVRLVTHRHIDAATVDEALERLRPLLE